MRSAIFSDIHGNRQAFEACLRDAAHRGAEATILLGDYVGYGGDPEWVTAKVMELTASGSVALRGNHDTAVLDTGVEMNSQARAAMDWTRGELGRAERDFLFGLPLTERRGDVLYVHADASRPDEWLYVSDAADAARSLKGTDARVVFCGHTHHPAVHSMSATGKMTGFRPVEGVPIRLLPRHRWVVVAGSVGQPRDGSPAASYLLFDDATGEIEFRRAPYDIDAAAARIRERKLPAWLAERLYLGK